MDAALSEKRLFMDIPLSCVRFMVRVRTGQAVARADGVTAVSRRGLGRAATIRAEPAIGVAGSLSHSDTNCCPGVTEVSCVELMHIKTRNCLNLHY